VGLALSLWLAPLLARADSDDPNAPPHFEFSLRAAGFYGPVDGFVQVPLGGNPGTSSDRRPSFHEIGVHDAAFYEVTGRLGWGHFAAFAGYSGLELDGSETLDQTLVSHGVTFAAGQAIHSKTELNVPNFGAGWAFDFDDGKLQLFPKLDVALLDFSTSTDAPGLHAARSYTTTTVRLGAEARYQLGGGFALEFDGVTSVPIPHTPQLTNVTGRVSYALFPTSPVHGSVFLGMGGRWIYFEDAQQLPNRIDLRSGPLVTGGFTVAF
jgi:hypothetical protein